MRYWDASALVPAFIREDNTDRAREWLGEDPEIVTWGWTKVEISSAIERLTRSNELTRSQRRDALDGLDQLARSWDEVIDLVAVRSRALSLLARHSLRAADAGQLGAALLVAEAGGVDITFVCFDENLAIAAEREGLTTLPAV